MEQLFPEYQTLWRQFLEDSMRRYIAPTREGTPRGELIGLSPVKYHASLLCLIKLKQKDIAEGLKVSHGLLRKWRTEEAFQEQVHEHCRKFADLFIKNIHDRIKRRQTAIDAFYAQPLSEMASQELPSFDYSEIADAKFYSDLAQDYIVSALSTEIRKATEEQNLTLMNETSSMIDVMRHFQGEAQPEILKEGDRELLKQMRTFMIKDVIRKMQKPEITDDDRKEIIHTMKELLRGIA